MFVHLSRLKGNVHMSYKVIFVYLFFNSFLCFDVMQNVYGNDHIPHVFALI